MDFDEHERDAGEPSSAAAAPALPVADIEELSPRPGRRPRLWALSAAFVTVVVVAALVFTLPGSHWKSPVVVLGEAAARTTASGTARSSSDEIVTIGSQTIEPVHIEGAEDFGAKTSTLTVFDSNQNTIETVRSLAGTSYISIPAAPDPLPGGAHWVAVTAADLELDPSVVSNVGSADPSSGLQFLSAIDGNPRVVDHDPLDLVKVTHYAFTLDLQSLFDRLKEGSSALGVPGFASGLEKVKSLVDLTKIPGEAWIDSAGRVRRLTMTIGIVEAGQSLKVVTDVRFSHFNEAVTVAEPDASDTVRFKDVPHFFSDFARQSALQG